ncbi:hypothetical protein KY290_005307 [Solanum tuberosum]|uniref:Uncharacterized protein n=2 Tax=Solanum tuberosum TaxID=4113 RepID=A0ABQ7WE56_SOLTU|nr:PREDICTED: uncharacterized protein LOC102595719 [Solanum tuberosum]KAH0720367.1 hypothetical protein KY284_005397 [Solanum tuberosum]KAH0723874.1 hypothetical protein KY289_006918 [Solanum tuberosum]KAH0778880.1 hypothetical protein KY290_005307 [Solanum tuberosum]
MSLSLIQSYSSSEEEEQEQEEEPHYDYSDDDLKDDVPQNRYKPFFNPNPSSSSLLPSALDAFSEISGPPEFLNNIVEEAGKDVNEQRHGRRKYSRNKNDLPAGAVVESKAQLVGIHERVRSDVGGGIPKTATGQGNASVGTAQGGKPVATASYPGAEDAAELLRMCLKCGIPKTYTHSKGMVCPACSDHPVNSDEEPVKKKGSTVKDKEKNKRMKGQSSHATWKSETEMHLRQQFD